MARPLVVGNWKMHTTVEEARALVHTMIARLQALESVDVVLCPPFVSLAAVSGILRGTRVGLGAQNVHWEEQGAFTGEVSPGMLRGLCRYVIVGHSERRRGMGESNEAVNAKVRASLASGLAPILCVGETLEEREEGRAGEVVSCQVLSALEGVRSIESLAVAYEPVWAIGTGRAADGPAAEEMVSLVRRALEQRYGRSPAGGVPLLYGGSVSAANIGQFVSQPNVDGALVGGASLKPDEFVSIASRSCSPTP